MKRDRDRLNSRTKESLTRSRPANCRVAKPVPRIAFVRGMREPRGTIVEGRPTRAHGQLENSQGNRPDREGRCSSSVFGLFGRTVDRVYENSPRCSRTVNILLERVLRSSIPTDKYPLRTRTRTNEHLLPLNVESTQPSLPRSDLRWTNEGLPYVGSRLKLADKFERQKLYGGSNEMPGLSDAIEFQICRIHIASRA